MLIIVYVLRLSFRRAAEGLSMLCSSYSDRLGSPLDEKVGRCERLFDE